MKLFKEAGPGGSQAVLAEKEKMGSPYTGVVLSLNEVVKPRATYKIIDEKHNLFFTYKDLGVGPYDIHIFLQHFLLDFLRGSARQPGSYPMAIVKHLLTKPKQS